MLIKTVRNCLFLGLAGFFIFTFPYIQNTWNLNLEIGWDIPIRPRYTYFLPLWFIGIFVFYQKKLTTAPKTIGYYFWFHFLASFIPIFFINYPFSKYLFNEKFVLLYFFSQILLLAFLIWLNKKLKNA